MLHNVREGFFLRNSRCVIHTFIPDLIWTLPLAHSRSGTTQLRRRPFWSTFFVRVSGSQSSCLISAPVELGNDYAHRSPEDAGCKFLGFLLQRHGASWVLCCLPTTCHEGFFFWAVYSINRNKRHVNKDDSISTYPHSLIPCTYMPTPSSANKLVVPGFINAVRCCCFLR